MREDPLFEKFIAAHAKAAAKPTSKNIFEMEQAERALSILQGMDILEGEINKRLEQLNSAPAAHNQAEVVKYMKARVFIYNARRTLGVAREKFTQAQSELNEKTKDQLLQQVEAHKASAAALLQRSHDILNQYDGFLNHIPAHDVEHLNANHAMYDEVMARDPDQSCVVRMGEPGNYSYEVIFP